MNSNITLQQLIYVVAVDSHGSFVDAAAECKVSQPALSMQIRKLENTLGVILFDRSRQPVRPTEIGRRIIAQARLVLREASRIQETADVAQGEMKGEYHLGAVGSLASRLLPSVLRTFSENHPDVIVTVHELSIDELTEGLHVNAFDAGIAPLPLAIDSLSQRQLFHEPFLAYVPRSHPLYASAHIIQSDLAGEHLFLPTGIDGPPEQGSGSYPFNTRMNETVPIRWKGGTFDALRRLAEEGLGIAILPHLVADELRRTGTEDMLREFADGPPYRTVGIIHADSHARAHITDALASTIVNAVPPSLLKEPE